MTGVGLPPTIAALLPRYRELATGLGYVELRELLPKGADHAATVAAIEREYVEQNGRGPWYYTTTREGGDIQIQIERDAR